MIISTVNNNTHTDIEREEEEEEPMTFVMTVKVMFWAVLNPGPDADSIPDKGFTGHMANFLFAVYQVLVAIILLNLLIAMMNSTVQKIQDKRMLYWKFERTSVWLDFISNMYILPPPLYLLWLPTIPIYIVYVALDATYRKRNPNEEKDRRVSMIISNEAEQNRNTSLKKKCVMDPIEGERRKAHAMLIQTLIKRFLQKDTNLANFQQSFDVSYRNKKPPDVSKMQEMRRTRGHEHNLKTGSSKYTHDNQTYV